MLLSRTFLALVLCTSFAAIAQQPAAPLPVYDVASIHENKSANNVVRVQTLDSTFTATNVPLSDLISMAYDIRLDIISGLPGWASSTRFDVSAKVSEPDIAALNKLSREQHHAMIRALLADRFHLQAHIETKTLPVYDLVIAKGGSKLTENTIPADLAAPAAPGPSGLKPGSMMVSETQMTAVAIPLANLAQNLAFRVERNVIDKTGLTGKYSFTLKWRRENAPAADDNNPDLFTAIQEQLGLKLEPSKGPVDTLVIDHVEMPSEN